MTSPNCTSARILFCQILVTSVAYLAKAATAFFGVTTGDPINTGATSIFTTGNFPNSTPARRTEAASIYAILTGRVSQISRSASLNPDSKQPSYTPFRELNQRIDLNVLKRTRIGEKFTVDFRAQFLNAFNMTDFFLVALADASAQGIGAQFGQTRTALRDNTVSGTNDPGGRLIEFQLRINF